MLTGLTNDYPSALRPPLQVIGAEGVEYAAGVYVLTWDDRIVFCADAMGPMLVGMDEPVHVLQRGAPSTTSSTSRRSP